ncbi:CRISPR-associated endonuclease Cas2 [Candidatus Wolfebacteria bacterium]|nr:CRISPR-associated endonuclease Cas2 [Candidatus Wolfebacteria bacterium]
MKGEITLKILEKIGEVSFGVADLCAAILSSGYGASYGKLQYEISKRQNARDKKSIERQFKNIERQKYHKMIYKLKKDGLIKEEGSDKKFFVITIKGKEKLKKLKNGLIKIKELPEIFYEKEKIDSFVIITFDIPELHKKKREWLRAVLVNLGFGMLQKSVWIGKIKIPKKLIDDLRRLKLIDYVEILGVNKSGSLKQLN